jgi:hypothetical protein
MMKIKVPPEKAILLINERIADLSSIRRDQKGIGYYDFVGWCSKTWPVIDSIYAEGDHHPEELRSIALSNCSCNSHIQTLMLAEEYHSRLNDYVSEIRASMKIPDE